MHCNELSFQKLQHHFDNDFVIAEIYSTSSMHGFEVGSEHTISPIA